MPNLIKEIRKSLNLKPYRFFRLLNDEGLVHKLSLSGYLYKERSRISRLSPGELEQLRKVSGLAAQEFWDRFIIPLALVEPKRKQKKVHRKKAPAKAEA
jgi:DNA-binding transcriptional regulator YiaG